MYNVIRRDLPTKLPEGVRERRMTAIYEAHRRNLANESSMSRDELRRWKELCRTDPMMSNESAQQMSGAAGNVFVQHAMFLKGVMRELTVDERATVEYFDSGTFND